MKRCWIVEFPGVWLQGYAVVFAQDGHEVMRHVEKLLREHKLNPEASPIRFYEIAPTGAHLIWNGNY